MKGSQKVIDQLNAALSSELTAIAEYMVHAEMCDNWGYKKLGAETKQRAFQEMHHAEGLIERILYLDGTPEVAVALKPKIGQNVTRQLEIALADELEAVRDYNNSILICGKEHDDGSRELFERMLKDEEGHVDYLEAQLHTIEEMGIANYLSEKL